MTKEEMSKDEILRKWVGLIPYLYLEKSIGQIHSAMDEYAKQQAIDFALNYAKSFHDDTYIKPTEAELERMSFRYDKFIKVQSENK